MKMRLQIIHSILPKQKSNWCSLILAWALLTDVLAPGAIAKVASKSVNSAKELTVICKNIQVAQEVLVLETASGVGVPVRLSEIIDMGKKTVALGEELGFSPPEMGQLQQLGKLESTISKACEYLTPPLRESFELFDKAQEFLKPYKGFMSESEARALIQQTGIKTFPRPHGIPDNFRVKLSKRGAGMVYVHPNHTHTSVRVMPGKPHSPFPYQQQPYVIYMQDGKYMNKLGCAVSSGELPEAHIPYNDFFSEICDVK